ncbi:RNA 2',3'-cyclic phosphodiesterase [Eubacteriales bacterium OttesenSCG-928-K08]|nr:RNA 2',3'-cyclic phosphodiesterase [Eubacteriales bacterium OttesenSCG-928-K08]
MRLFIAIPIPPDVRRALVDAQAQLRQIASGGRYVPQNNFHATLHFIGESSSIVEASSAMEQAVRGIRPFLFRLESFGRFYRGEQYTAYISLGGDLLELYRLHETLVGALADFGFSTRGAKRLTPHVTLARGLTAAAGEDTFSSLVLSAGAGRAFTANQVVLYESRNVNGSMVYTPIHKCMLI